jgi:hypothetical protein
MELSTTPRNAIDLTSEAWAEDCDPIVADQSTLDGKLYGAEVWDVVAVGLAKRELAWICRDFVRRTAEGIVRASWRVARESAPGSASGLVYRP